VRFNSIDAAVRNGNHGRDHFVLAALQRQLWRHQRTESAERMKEGIRNQGMGGNNTGALAIVSGWTGAAYSTGYSARWASIAFFTRSSSSIETVFIQVTITTS